MLGFADKATGLVHAPIADYAMPGVHWAALATGLAGLVGTVVVFIGAWVVARVLVGKGRRRSGAVPLGAEL